MRKSKKKDLKKERERGGFEIFRFFLFFIACLGVFGAAVNYGAFDIFPGIPYLALGIFLSLKGGKKYFFYLFLTLSLSIPLFFLKKEHGILFHPPLNKTVFLSRDICYVKYPEFILLSEVAKSSCSHENMTEALDSGIFKKGLALRIKEVGISNADFGENYFFQSDTEKGLLYYSFNLDGDHPLFLWREGKGVKESQLRRWFFYYPSLLMYGPILPFLILLN